MSFRGSAATVVARLFRLINPQGQVVGEFSPDIPVYHDPGLLLWHSSSHASMLAWSNPDTEPSNHTIYLSTPVGPTPVSSNTLLVLEHNDITNLDVATLHVGSVEGIRCTNDGVNSVTKLTGGSLEFESTLGLIISTPGGTFIDDGSGSPGRQARFMVGASNTTGADTGNIVGPAGPTVMGGSSSGALALRTGDQVHFWGDAYIGCAAGGGQMSVVVYVNGVTTGREAALSNTVAGLTVTAAISPAIFIVPSDGNYTFDLRYASSGGTYRVVYSVLHLQVFATK